MNSARHRLRQEGSDSRPIPAAYGNAVKRDLAGCSSRACLSLSASIWGLGVAVYEQHSGTRKSENARKAGEKTNHVQR